jgi:hypothetical protein
MNFEYDIFISYGPSGNKEDEWISQWSAKFCECLAIMMSRLTEQKLTILLHDDLRTRKKLLEENAAGIFSGTAIFVSIIAPEYLESKEYVRELEEIHKTIYSKPGNTYGTGSRFFKVITQPVSQEIQPSFLENELSYDFYEINRYSKKAKTYAINEEDESYNKFWSTLVDLAYDVNNSLQMLTSGKKEVIRPQEKKFIYIAETTVDQKDNRDILKRELQHMGYGILPHIPLIDDGEKLGDIIESYLKRSILSIHLMGAYYGDYVKNSKYSLIDLQNHAVKSYIDTSGEAGKLIRMIWIPNDLKASDQRQALYLKRLKRDEAQEKTEIIEAPLEVFKSILIDKIRELNEPVKIKAKDRKKIYLIYEHDDKKVLTPLIEEINSRNYSVIDNDSNDNKKNLVSKHIENLIDCDAVIIYNGNNGKEWLNSKIRDLIKAPGYGKSGSFQKIGIISDQEPDKKIMDFLAGTKIIMDKEINSAFLKKFLETPDRNNDKRS